MSVTTAEPMKSVNDPLSFTVTDVTGLKRFEFDDVDGHRTVSDVASSVAVAMDLPSELPYALRDEQRARMLQQEEPLGQQIDTSADLVVIPRSHLG